MVSKPKVALVRGVFLNAFEMQTYEAISDKFSFTAFSSLNPIQDKFNFPTIHLPSLTDGPNFPYKTQFFNRLFVDMHYLVGLENKLKGFDIAHSAENYFHYTKQCIDAKLQGKVKKVIVTEWENIPHNNEGIFGRKHFKKLINDNADKFIAVSTISQKMLLNEGVEEKRVTVIPPGIDTNVFTPKNKKANQFITILFVGRLEEEKGVFDVLDAFASVVKSNKNLRMEIIGSGSQENALRLREKELGIESFITHKTASYEDMPSIYQDADIFIAPSKKSRYWQEQWGMMLLEAQSSGLPIITTRSGAIEENVGEVALLAEEGDAVQMAKYLNELIKSASLRKTLGAKARKRAIKLYDTKIVSEKIANVYKEGLE